MNILLSLVLLFSPIKAESGKFTITQDGHKIGTEEFSITPRKGGYVVQGHTVINVQGRSFDLKSHMELDENLKPTLYEYTSEGNSIRLKVEDPVSDLETNVQGQKDERDVRFPADGVIVDDNFFHHYAILLYRAAASGLTTVSAFVPQQMTLGSMTIRNTGNRVYELETENLKVIATTDNEGRLIRLTVPDAKVVVER